MDTHVRAGPDVVPRLMNDHDLVRAARDAGCRGLVIKSHVESTASRARLARDNRLARGRDLRRSRVESLLGDQLALAEISGVWFERCYVSPLTRGPLAAIAEQMRAVGRRAPPWRRTSAGRTTSRRSM